MSQQAYQHCATYEGAETRQAAVYLSGRGYALCRIGRWREGAADYAAALALLDRVDPADHPDRLDLLINACFDWIQLDDIDQARRHCEASEAMAKRLFGEGSSGHIRARLYRLGFTVAAGELDAAHAEAESVKQAIRTAYDPAAAGLVWVDNLLAEIHRIEGDHASMRERILPMALGPNQNTNFQTVAIAMLALACHHAPAPVCPADIHAQADARLAEPAFRQHPARAHALLPLAQLSLLRGHTAEAAARLDDLESAAALPSVRLDPQHRWLLEARMLRGDVHAARGEPEQARQAWAAAESGLAARYDADHPLRRRLASRMAALRPN